VVGLSQPGGEGHRQGQSNFQPSASEPTFVPKTSAVLPLPHPSHAFRSPCPMELRGIYEGCRRISRGKTEDGRSVDCDQFVCISLTRLRELSWLSIFSRLSALTPRPDRPRGTLRMIALGNNEYLGFPSTCADETDLPIRLGFANCLFKNRKPYNFDVVSSSVV
jgi:hypothetical protein